MVLINKKIVASGFGVLCLYVALFSCTSFLKPEKQIRGYLMYTINPDIKFDSIGNRLYHTLSDSMYTKVFYFKNYVVVVQNFKWRKMRLTENPDSIPFLLKDKIIVFRNGSNEGLLFDDSNGMVSSINIDSFLTKSRVFESEERTLSFKQCDYSLSSSDTTTDYIDQVYSVTGKSDTTLKGVFEVKYYRGKNFNSPVYLNKYLEDSVGFRISKMVFTTYARHVPPTNVFFEKTVITRAIQTIDEDLSVYFEKCKIPMPE